MAFFRGFGPRRAAVWAEQPFFSFAIIFYHPKEHSLRVSALYSKIFLNYTFGLDISRSALKDPKGSHKKKSDQERHFQGTQVPPNIARFWTIRYVTLSLKKSKSVSLDLADFFFRDS